MPVFLVTFNLIILHRLIKKPTSGPNTHSIGPPPPDTSGKKNEVKGRRERGGERGEQKERKQGGNWQKKRN